MKLIVFMSFLLIVNSCCASQDSDNCLAKWQVAHRLCQQATDNNKPEFVYYIGTSILGNDWRKIMAAFHQVVFSELSQDGQMSNEIFENEEQSLAQERVLFDLLDRPDADKPVGVDEFVVNSIFNLVDNKKKG